MHCYLALTLKAQGHILFSMVDYAGTRIKTMLVGSKADIQNPKF